MRLAAALLLVLASPAQAWDPGLTACKHHCGQDATACRLGCRDSRCINACEARRLKCTARCESCR